VLAMAQARQIDAVLVTEIRPVGRSTKDFLETLDELHDRGVSVLPLNGQSFDIGSANGCPMRTFIAVLAKFERDLIKERVKSGHGDADHAARTSSGGGLNKTAPSLPSVEMDPCIEIGASVP